MTRYAIPIAVFLAGSSMPAAGQDTQPLPASTDAIEPMSSEEALVLDAKAYSQRYSVSLEEAMQRLIVMAGSAEQIDAIEKELGDDLSGAYFDNGAEFQLVVRTRGSRNLPGRRLEGRVPPGQARRASGNNSAQAGAGRLLVTAADLNLADAVIRRPKGAMVKFNPGGKGSKRQVSREIERNFSAVRAALPTLQALHYDDTTGNVVAEVVGAQGSAQVSEALTNRFSVPINIKWLPNAIQKVTLRGGAQLWYSTANSAQCTTGFVGWAPPPAGGSHSTEFGVFTAGHCVSAGYGIGFKDTTGKMFNLIEDRGLFLDTASADIRFLKAPAGLGAASQFFGNRNEAARTLTGRRTIASTTGTVTNQGSASTATTGTFVCFYGLRTGPSNGQGCGEVTFNGFSYSGGAGYYVRIKGNFACNQGDSGGPVFAYTTAFGLTSGCVTLSNSPVANELDYTSMDAAYAYGYKLSY